MEEHRLGGRATEELLPGAFRVPAWLVADTWSSALRGEGGELG